MAFLMKYKFAANPDAQLFQGEPLLPAIGTAIELLRFVAAGGQSLVLNVPRMANNEKSPDPEIEAFS